MNLRSKKGFTLVELIIVIAILGIIALIAVPSLTGVQKRSQVNADIRTAEQIGKAVRIWLTDTQNVSETVEREGAIKSSYVTLKSLKDTNDFDTYLSTEYIPKASTEEGISYYIKLAENEKIVVAIAAEELEADPAIAYTYNDSGVTIPAIAYLEGTSEVTADSIETFFGTDEGGEGGEG